MSRFVASGAQLERLSDSKQRAFFKGFTLSCSPGLSVFAEWPDRFPKPAYYEAVALAAAKIIGGQEENSVKSALEKDLKYCMEQSAVLGRFYRIDRAKWHIDCLADVAGSTSTVEALTGQSVPK